ncbi:putative lipid II flippase FtsW [Patescibacteria group bacterium]|nr:putative lipid II flippase FtsW [Patescibacteria group bacterium]
MNLPYSKKVDRWTALTVFALVLFGIVMIYSASVIVAHTMYGDDRYFVKRQIIWALLGGAGAVVMANIDYHFWKKWALWMLGITVFLLVAVFFFSRGEINGAHRWISLPGGQSFQPSELAKLTFIVYLSAWLVERRQKLGEVVETFLPYIGVLGVIAFLMLKEPDFGTLMIIVAISIAMYGVAGMTWKQVGIGVVVLVLAIGLSLTSSYRRERVMTFLNPGSDTQGTAYQVKNIAIAVGSGGLKGLGFGQSKQKRLFLPEPFTDSIFAVISEELGFVWAAALILAFGFLIYRGFMIAAHAPDLFGQLLAVGISTWFGVQAFLNLGSMVNLVPLVGVPLPFISYGGSSLGICLLAVGLLLNISRFSDKQPKEKKA